jgi:dienelactone hydrolase
MKLVAILFAAACVGSPASAQNTGEEQLSFASLTMDDAQFLSGRIAEAEPVTLTARLRMPASASVPVPAIVLLHGSDGARSAAAWNWASVFARTGYASLRIDSYTARGFEEIYTNQGGVGEFNNLIDAFEALRLLAGDPRIDRDRIAVMGFSRGGIPALYSAMTRFEQFYAPDGLRFAAHLPFYPPCNFALEDELDVGPEPIRAFHGDADVWNPLAACADYIERLKAAGADASITVYPDAHHSFDHPGSPSYNVVSDAQTSRACFRREEAGVLINAATGAPFSWTDDCVERGPAVQMNPAAMSAAERDVLAVLSIVFRR